MLVVDTCLPKTTDKIKRLRILIAVSPVHVAVISRVYLFLISKRRRKNRVHPCARPTAGIKRSYGEQNELRIAQCESVRIARRVPSTTLSSTRISNEASVTGCRQTLAGAAANPSHFPVQRQRTRKARWQQAVLQRFLRNVFSWELSCALCAVQA